MTTHFILIRVVQKDQLYLELSKDKTLTHSWVFNVISRLCVTKLLTDHTYVMHMICYVINVIASNICLSCWDTSNYAQSKNDYTNHDISTPKQGRVPKLCTTYKQHTNAIRVKIVSTEELSHATGKNEFGHNKEKEICLSKVVILDFLLSELFLELSHHRPRVLLMFCSREHLLH